jgi:glycosyltransferase involved in cell wall biosynthesis
MVLYIKRRWNESDLVNSSKYSDKMKILVVHNKYIQYGGEDTVVAQEVKAYKSLGHEVNLYQPTNKELSKIEQFFGVFNLKSAFKFSRVIKDFKPDVIHFHNIIYKITPSVFWFIPKHIKVLMTIHNYRFLCPSGTLFIDGNINLDSQSFSGLLKNIKKGVYQNSIVKTTFLSLIYQFNIFIGSFRRVNTFIFLNPFSKELHTTRFPSLFKRGVVKPNFILSSEKNLKTKKNIDVIFIGRFSEEKGILKCMPHLIKAEHLTIHLVGDGPDFNEAKSLGSTQKHITFHGKLSRNKVLTLLSQSKFLIFPSECFEGMPMTIIEAFSVGTPVIAKKIGAMKTMIRHGEIGLIYEHVDELTEIFNTLNDQNLEFYAERAFKEFNDKYTFEVGMRNLNKLINQP